MTPRVALVTCDAFPRLYGDDLLLVPALAALGLAGEPSVWSDPAVDWSSFDAIVIRSPWDWHHSGSLCDRFPSKRGHHNRRRRRDIHRMSCKARRLFTQGFDLRTDSSTGMLARFTTPGPEVAPFTDFKQTDPTVSQTFDTSALHHLEFIVGRGDFNFCVHDLKFLNAAGAEVKP